MTSVFCEYRKPKLLHVCILNHHHKPQPSHFFLLKGLYHRNMRLQPIIHLQMSETLKSQNLKDEMTLFEED